MPSSAPTFSGNVTADFDWRQEGPQTWDIDIQTDKGTLALRMGGNVLEIDGKPSAGENTIMDDHPALYAHMATLVRTGQSDVDLAPMVHVADALTLGERRIRRRLRLLKGPHHADRKTPDREQERPDLRLLSRPRPLARLLRRHPGPRECGL